MGSKIRPFDQLNAMNINSTKEGTEALGIPFLDGWSTVGTTATITYFRGHIRTWGHEFKHCLDKFVHRDPVRTTLQKGFQFTDVVRGQFHHHRG